MPRGYLRLRLGPMYASKTKGMLSDLDRHRYANKKCLVVAHVSDTRYVSAPDTNVIIDNSGGKHEDFPVMRVATLGEASPFVENYDVVGIDEIGFYPDVMVANEWANAGKYVIAAGIDGDYLQRPFGNTLLLVPFAEEVIKQLAVCQKCFADAAFTIRREVPETTVDKPDVGGKDKYLAVCRNCLP